MEFLAKDQSLIAYFTYLDCSDNFLNKYQGLETQAAEGGRKARGFTWKVHFSLGMAKFAAGGGGWKSWLCFIIYLSLLVLHKYIGN